MNKKYTTTMEDAADGSGDGILTFPPELLADMGWKVLAVILLGGLESIGGCIIAGPVIGVLERVCFYYLNPLIGGDLGDIVSYIVMIIILAVKPYGFMGLTRIERI